MLPKNLYDLLTSFQLLIPLTPNSLYLTAKPILLEPHNQLSKRLGINLLHQFGKHHFNHLSLA